MDTSSTRKFQRKAKTENLSTMAQQGPLEADERTGFFLEKALKSGKNDGRCIFASLRNKVIKNIKKQCSFLE